MSFYDVYAAVRSRWVAQWSYTPTAYENKPFSPSIGGEWTRLAIRPGTSAQVSLGAPKTLDRHVGVVFAQIFVPAGQGEERARWLADKASEIFRKLDVTAGTGKLTFRVPSIQAADQGGDDWWQINVVCPYQYDELT